MYDFSSSDHESSALTGNTEEEWTKGEKQPKACKDVPFAIVFNLHLVAMVGVAVLFGRDILQESVNGITSSGTSDENIDANNYNGVIYTTAIIGGLTLITSSIVLTFMIQFASILIEAALIGSVVLSLIACVMSFLLGSLIGAVFALIFFAINICYARYVWHRIPFATANLVTSLTVVKRNFGIILLAFVFVIVALLWSLLWTLAFSGVYDQTLVCDGETCSMNYGYLFLLLLSYYWTHQVIMNTIHVTVAGLVGTWWFTPEEASSCCSSGVTSSLVRACTFSHGSICFGSLIVAIIQALRQLVNTARSQGERNDLLLCLVECILSCLEGIAEFFNKWAYIYVGLYGYGYVDAGKNVMRLFKSRGWDVIITDDLVSNTLGLMSVMVGLVMGAVGLLIELSTDWFVVFEDVAQPFAFLIAFLVGLVLCSIMLSPVASGVDTVIVLFAEAPTEFQSNHAELSNSMRSAWMAAYPDIIH